MQATIERPEIIIPEKLEEQKDVELVMSNARSFVIHTEGQAIEAADKLKSIKSKWKDLEAKRKTLAIPIDASKTALQKLFKPLLEQLERAESMIKTSLITFQREQEAIRREEERKAQEIFERQQEKERLALEARIKKAEEKEDAVKAESLKEKLEEPVFVPAPTITAAPKIAGISTSKKWKHKVVNFSLVPDQYKLINDKMLAGIAVATKGTLEIPGIEYFCEEIMSARV